jgi:hypothetical protein
MFPHDQDAAPMMLQYLGTEVSQTSVTQNRDALTRERDLLRDSAGGGQWFCKHSFGSAEFVRDWMQVAFRYQQCVREGSVVIDDPDNSSTRAVI